MRAFTTLILPLLICGPLSAQETSPPAKPEAKVQAKPSSQRPQLPLFPERTIILKHYSPTGLDASRLASRAQQLWGRRFLVGEKREDARKVQNILYIGDAVVVYDTRTMVKTILEGLAQMEAAGARTPNAPTAMFEYAPKHVSAQALARSLDSLVDRRRGRGVGSGIVKVDFVQELNRLIVQGTSQGLAAAREFIKKLDVPEPEIVLTSWIIQGSQSGKEDAQIPLPDDLVGNLRKLVPFEHFNSLGMGLVRTSVQTGGDIQLQIDLGTFGSASLEFRSGMFNASSSTLQLSRCSCSIRSKIRKSTQHFSTRTSLRSGEYTVLGALGSQPVFVVLRMVPAR